MLQGLGPRFPGVELWCSHTAFRQCVATCRQPDGCIVPHPFRGVQRREHWPAANLACACELPAVQQYSPPAPARPRLCHTGELPQQDNFELHEPSPRHTDKTQVRHVGRDSQCRYLIRHSQCMSSPPSANLLKKTSSGSGTSFCAGTHMPAGLRYCPAVYVSHSCVRPSGAAGRRLRRILLKLHDTGRTDILPDRRVAWSRSHCPGGGPGVPQGGAYPHPNDNLPRP